MNKEVEPKQVTQPKSIVDSLIDSVLEVPKAVVNGLADLALTGAEIVEEVVSGFAKSLANVIIPETNPTSQPAKA
ncbi:MAG: hypothetical protein ACMG57_03505 [Candidatus Dojkabacteria bacterium]